MINNYDEFLIVKEYKTCRIACV